MNPLTDRTVTGVVLSPDHETLTFSTTEGAVIAITRGGDCCCSRTWIESIEGAESLTGRVVIAVENIGMPDLGNVGTAANPKVEDVRYYGTKITADNGAICVIDFRNNSNGYYGGWLDWTASD